jgi:hypothetical protein
MSTIWTYCKKLHSAAIQPTITTTIDQQYKRYSNGKQRFIDRWFQQTVLQITGYCNVNDVKITYLAYTGSNRTIVHKSVINLFDNQHGQLRSFYQNVITAEGHKAQIIGIKTC